MKMQNVKDEHTITSIGTCALLTTAPITFNVQVDTKEMSGPKNKFQPGSFGTSKTHSSNTRMPEPGEKTHFRNELLSPSGLLVNARHELALER